MNPHVKDILRSVPSTLKPLYRIILAEDNVFTFSQKFANPVLGERVWFRHPASDDSGMTLLVPASDIYRKHSTHPFLGGS